MKRSSRSVGRSVGQALSGCCLRRGRKMVKCFPGSGLLQKWAGRRCKLARRGLNLRANLNCRNNNLHQKDTPPRSRQFLVNVLRHRPANNNRRRLIGLGEAHNATVPVPHRTSILPSNHTEERGSNSYTSGGRTFEPTLLYISSSPGQHVAK